MRQTLAFLIAIGVLLVAAPAAQTGHALFQQALTKERAEGKLQEAITLYERVVKEFAADRTLAAKALVQIGLCYEKLGRDEARKAYERLLRDFADQKDEAARARSRLAALVRPAADEKSLAARRVWAEPDTDNLGRPSPDGRWLSYTDWETGDLAVRNLATGEKRRLTNKGTWDSIEFAEFSVFSPDSRQIAYGWFNDAHGYDLRVVAVDGGQPRVVFRTDAPQGWIRPGGWTADGRHVVVHLEHAGMPSEIAMVTVSTGAKRVLRRLEETGPGNLSVSPDGRYLAFDWLARPNALANDVFLLSLDDGRDVPLIEHPANDQCPVWTPDGGGVVFVSDRTGSPALWIVDVRKGAAHGAARIVKSDMGSAVPLGFTRAGTLIYSVRMMEQDVYVAEIEPATGRVVGPPTVAAQRFLGANLHPDWSPDGRYLSYLSRRRVGGIGPGSQVLTILNVETRESRDLMPRLAQVQRPRWAPDGKALLVAGVDSKRRGFYRIDAATGDVSPIVELEPGLSAGNARWLPDGRSLLYTVVSRTQRLLVRDVVSGAERQLFEGARDRGVVDAALSPDGKWVAFWTSEPARDPDGVVIKVVPFEGGEPRDVVRGPIAGGRGLSWLPDGRHLLFVRFVKGSSSGLNRTLQPWIVNVDSGKAWPIDLVRDTLHQLRLHPDGRRIAFSSGGRSPEIWALENLLSSPGAGATQARRR